MGNHARHENDVTTHKTITDRNTIEMTVKRATGNIFLEGSSAT